MANGASSLVVLAAVVACGVANARTAKVEWTVKMTVRRLSYKAIDCRHSQLC